MDVSKCGIDCNCICQDSCPTEAIEVVLKGEEKAEASVERMVAFLKSVDLSMKLSDVGIDSSKFEVLAEDTLRIYGNRDGCLENTRKLYRDDIINILKMSL